MGNTRAQNATLPVVSLGDLVADVVVPIAQLPVRPWEHQLASDMLIEAGGTGNFLILAQRLGLQTQPLGVAGQDLFGEYVRTALASEGVDLAHVIVPPDSRTTVSIVLVDAAARHVFVWMNGTGQLQGFEPAWRAIVEGAGAVFTTGYAFQPTATFAPAAVLACLEIAHGREVPVFFDLGPVAAQAERTMIEAAISRTTVFLATDEEIAGWTGLDDPHTAAGRLLAQGPAMVVVKLGARGCLLATGEEYVQVAGFPASVRNTAGAGDAFSAACVYGYLHGLPLEQIGLLANAVGARAVAALGTGTRLPGKQEIAQLLVEHGHSFFEGR